jgi:hypothetical protein
VIAPLLLALIIAQASGSPPEQRMHAVFLAPPGLPTFQPDLEKAVADRLKLDFVEHRASTFDRTALYLPTEIVQDVCRDTQLPRLVAANAVTTRPTNATSSALVLSVSVYDCVNNLFINVAQSSTAVVPDGNPALLNTEYRGALKTLLEQLSPPIPKSPRTPAPR